MAHPLELAYKWQTPVTVSTVGLFVCVGILARSQVSGWISTIVAFVVVWIAFTALVYARTRAYLMVDGDLLAVRHVRDIHQIAAADLVAVREYLTPHGASYKLTVSADGQPARRYVAPVALLRKGHSTLFTWILTRAPQAQLDKGSRKTIDDLRNRGLIT